MVYTHIFDEEVEILSPNGSGSDLKEQHNRAFQQGVLRDLSGGQEGVASACSANAVEQKVLAEAFG